MPQQPTAQPTAQPAAQPAIGISAAAKEALAKLPAADAVEVMGELGRNAASNNNSNNFSTPAALNHEQALQQLSQLPSGTLKNVLQAHGIAPQ